MIYLVDFNFNFKNKKCNGIYTFNIFCMKELSIKIFTNFKEFINFKFNNNDKIIFNKISDIYKINLNEYNNIFYYTHSSSILQPNKKKYFNEEVKKELKEIEFLKKNKKIKIITQSHLLKKFLKKFFNNKILVLKEPIDIKIKKTKKEYDILINSGFYKRKNIEFILNKLKNSNLKILFLTDNEEEIKILFLKNNIKNFKILSNLNFLKVHEEIQKCKILIQFSKLEFLPYSITEFMFIGNIIINYDYNWGKLIEKKENFFYLKEKDFNEKEIRKIIEVKKDILKLEKYKLKIKNEWKKFEKFN